MDFAGSDDFRLFSQTSVADIGKVSAMFKNSYAPTYRALRSAVKQVFDSAMKGQYSRSELVPNNKTESKCDSYIRICFGKDRKHWCKKRKCHGASILSISQIGFKWPL